MHLKDIVSRNVRRLFQERGLKIKPFCETHDIPYGNVYRVLNPETSNPTLNNIELVANALRVPYWQLCIPLEDQFNKFARLYNDCDSASRSIIDSQLEALAERDRLKKA